MLQDPNDAPRYIVIKLAPSRFVIARRSVRKGWWHSIATTTAEHDASEMLQQLNARKAPDADEA